MAATYDPELSTDKDFIRLLVGDVYMEAGKYVLSNEEIEAVYDRSAGDLMKTVGRLLESISNDPRKLLILRDATGGAMTVQSLQSVYGEKARQWIS